MQGAPQHPKAPGRSVLTALACILAAAPACALGTGRAGDAPADTLRLGYFPSITHAPAIVGVKNKLFKKHLGSGIGLKTQIFNAGPAAVEALFAGAIDAAYLGPSPAINAFVKSKGEAIRIVSGATSGGASLVVDKQIDHARDLKGKKIATPQLGNTQDVAARNWLKQNGLSTDVQGGGDVFIVPQENAQALETFRSGDIAGAWVPEPWVSRLVFEAGGKVLVDEATLWPQGRFVTAHLIVRTAYAQQNPGVVRSLVAAQLEATEFINANSDQAKVLAASAISALSGKKLPPKVTDAAWGKLEFTYDPVAASLRQTAKHAVSLGLLEPMSLKGIYELSMLNELLTAAGKPPVGS